MLANGATVVLTYDEGSSSAGINGTSGGGNIYTVVVGPGRDPASTLGSTTTTRCWRRSSDGSGSHGYGAAGATPLPI